MTKQGLNLYQETLKARHSFGDERATIQQHPSPFEGIPLIYHQQQHVAGNNQPFFVQGHGTPCSTMGTPAASTNDTTAQRNGDTDCVSKIVTLNIGNFYTNKLYLKELMDNHDVICIQEHWLYNFEQATLDKFCAEQNFESFIKSTDDSDLINPHQMPRGKGGIAILWRQNISKNVKKIPDGSSRICRVMCDTAKGPVKIINVYMPCRGIKLSDELFCETLDELSEIIVKYSTSSIIILVGDLIASLHRD